MPATRPEVISIAGFDPSGGAGIAADLKTFESLKTYGFAICSANTIQHESELDSLSWTDPEFMLNQIRFLARKHKPIVAKIGIIENLEVLEQVIKELDNHFPGIRIIWDPILRASSGFNFHDQLNQEKLEGMLDKIYLITPNLDEMKSFAEGRPVNNVLLEWSKKCAIFLKGGHSIEEIGKDYLYFNEKVYPFRPRGKRVTPKHGSGCVLSAAITACLAKGFPLQKACLNGKEYATRYLESRKGLLGWHK